MPVMTNPAGQLLSLILALAIMLAGMPVYGSMPSGDENTSSPEHAERVQHPSGGQQAPCHGSETVVEIPQNMPCDQHDCCADDCRMYCASLMLALTFDHGSSILPAWARAEAPDSPFRLTTSFSSLLRPPQA